MSGAYQNKKASRKYEYTRLVCVVAAPNVSAVFQFGMQCVPNYVKHIINAARVVNFSLTNLKIHKNFYTKL